MATKAIVSDTTAYAAIVKFEEQEDGTVLAYGKATDATLDADEQICDPDWLKRAMPEWFKYGNIREQHSSIAAGVATEYEETEDGHYITAHIVDPSSAKKIKTGVLKGFSIGIRRPRVIKDNKAAGGRIVDGQIVEISVVDRPANPSCVLTVAKANKGELKAVKNVFTELNKGSDDQPRDENGRFASGGGDSSESDSRVQGGNRGELRHGGLTDKVNELANNADTEESQMLARESASYMEQAAKAEDDEKHLDLTYAAAEKLHEASSYETTRFGKEAMRDAADEIENYVSSYDKSVRARISKGSEDQPRDENGRFASGGGGDFARNDDGSMEATARMEQAEEAVAELRGYAEENQMEVEMGISSVADYVDYQDDNDPHAEPLGRLSESVSTANSKIENSATEPANVASALLASAASDLQIARTIANQQSKVGSDETRTAFSNLSESIGNQINTVNALDEQYRGGYLKSISTKENIMKADAILEMSKEWAGSDVVKFDQAAFDNARRALATLIQVEAGEMAEGHSETNSLSCLLSAVHALMEYNEGEAYEGETMLMPEMEMADKPEMKEDEMCAECGKAECDCKTYSKEKEEKCLECGCHEPANNHGNPDVTTAVVVSDKSEVSDIKTIVEDIVKELLTNPSVGEEITTKAAESERIEALETELAQVKSLAAPSGPKRFAAVSNRTPVNANKAKAAIYRAKAATTLDKSLANGYLALAIDLEKSE